MIYDRNNIFAKILRNEIPAKKISEDSYYLAFYDLYPRASVHALIIPKGSYIDAFDFNNNATAEEVVGFYKGVAAVIKELNLEENGFRLITNAGVNGRQEVPHYHIHLLGGEKLKEI